MFLDKETEALVKCIDLVKDLDEQAKLRVVKYLVEKFEIGIPRQGEKTNRSSSDQEDLKQIEANDEEVEEMAYEEVSAEEYPSLKDLLIKNYPKSEVEWILCYAFYASNYGNDVFTKDDITTGYKENKNYSESARNNLTNNIRGCIKKDWMKSINDNEFILKQEGKDYAIEVIKGNSTTKERKSISRKKKEE